MNRFVVAIVLTSLLCSTSTWAGDVSSLISLPMFNEMLKHRNEDVCQAKGFYSYDAFIEAAKSFEAFGTTGDINTRKRELAAFFGQTSHETTGGWSTAPDGPFAWGYCFLREGGHLATGGYSTGRGPIQLTGQSNYEKAGAAIHEDLANNPDLVATNAVVSFKAAIWFWMTAQYNKPSCHDVITGIWNPTAADQAANRLPGYGVITNIINGGIECGQGTPNPNSLNRIGFYKRYCDLFGLPYSQHLGCKDQRNFAQN